MPGAKKGAADRSKKCRLGVTAKEKSLDSEIGSMAGSPYILVFEGYGSTVTVLRNPGVGHGSLSGTMAAEAMVNNGVSVVITGTIGSHTLQVLKEAGISVHAGCAEVVREAMGKCMKNELPECNHAVFAGYIGI
jgi:predicted Fe-Mo cluster-binding NifX family protein